MSDVNTVVLSGRLTRDPEVRNVTIGDKEVAVVRLGLAVNKVINKKELTDFIDVTVWDTGAIAAGKVLKKGSKILVEGSLRVEKRTRKGEDKPYNELTLRCERWNLLSQPRGNADEAGDGAASTEITSTEDAPQLATAAGGKVVPF